ncbi:MAG: hypothetical protein ABIG44_14850, partial [Planctomycetota bacterium]
LPWQQTPISWSDSYGTGKSVRFGDLDLDGMAEIVFSCENANSRYGVGRLTPTAIGASAKTPLPGREGKGEGRSSNGLTLWSPQPINGTAGGKFDLVQLLDLDADGDLDVITTEESVNLGVVWYENPAVESEP